MHTHNRKTQRDTETQRGKKRGIRNERETELERQREEIWGEEKRKNRKFKGSRKRGQQNE